MIKNFKWLLLVSLSFVACNSSDDSSVIEEPASSGSANLAKYVASQTKVKIIAWRGACEVHERFTGEELRKYRADDPTIKIIAHPECPPDVIAESDFAGSTAHMIDWVKNNRPKRVVMVTECSMAANIANETPDVEFVKPCNLCPHMKRITLPKILDSLLYMKEEVLLDPSLTDRARMSVERMVNMVN